MYLTLQVTIVITLLIHFFTWLMDQVFIIKCETEHQKLGSGSGHWMDEGRRLDCCTRIWARAREEEEEDDEGQPRRLLYHAQRSSPSR